MRVLNERAFGTLDFYESYKQIRDECGIPGQHPYSFIQGTPVHGHGLSGIQIHAVKPDSDSNPRVLYDGNSACGSAWQRKDVTYIFLTGIGNSRKGSRSDQAAAMFAAMKRLLAAQSAGFRNVVRTWMHLDRILEWYDLFNVVRTEMFRSFGLIPLPEANAPGGAAYFPASTAVGGQNPAGSSCCCDVLAAAGPVEISVLPGMLQPSAFSYGSAFSRAVCIEDSESLRLFVSGTAAIDAAGHSLYPENAEAQISKTLEVIASLIAEKGATFKDIRSATVYLKRAGDWSIYEKIARRLGLTGLPAVFVVADICREELLFEMDALAVVDKTS
jgi:enamine deaminase RidA (YjgF/YER057c/UK114 family)